MTERRASIREEVAHGVIDGLRAFAADEEATRKFWKRGFDELAAHSSNGASQWIGKRILTWLITAVVGAGIVYLVRTGAIK